MKLRDDSDLEFAGDKNDDFKVRKWKESELKKEKDALTRNSSIDRI